MIQTAMVILLFSAGLAYAQVQDLIPQVGDAWTFFGHTRGSGWSPTGIAFDQHLNPEPGDVWTYFGPTLGAGWGAPLPTPAPVGSPSDPIPSVL